MFHILKSKIVGRKEWDILIGLSGIWGAAGALREEGCNEKLVMEDKRLMLIHVGTMLMHPDWQTLWKPAVL